MSSPRRFPMVLAGVFIFGLAGGCMPRMTIEEIADMRPPRAPELDRLDRLVGDWDTVGEVRMAVLDETLQTTGRSSAQWMLDKRFLREDAELDMGALGRVTGTSIWSYEPGANKYHMWWFDSLGETSHAVITFNHRTDTWHMRTRGRKYGYATSGRGTLRHVDDDTLEWTWQEFDGTGLFKLADMKGVSRRRP